MRRRDAETIRLSTTAQIAKRITDFTTEGSKPNAFADQDLVGFCQSRSFLDSPEGAGSTHQQVRSSGDTPFSTGRGFPKFSVSEERLGGSLRLCGRRSRIATLRRISRPSSFAKERTFFYCFAGTRSLNVWDPEDPPRKRLGVVRLAFLDRNRKDLGPPSPTNRFPTNPRSLYNLDGSFTITSRSRFRKDLVGIVHDAVKVYCFTLFDPFVTRMIWIERIFLLFLGVIIIIIRIRKDIHTHPWPLENILPLRESERDEDHKRKREEGRESEERINPFRKSKKVERSPVKKAMDQEMKKMLEKIMEDVGEIKEENRKMSRELEQLKSMMREKEEKWEREKMELKEKMTKLEEKMEEQEKRVRKKNIVVTGLDEEECENEKKLEKWMKAELEVENLRAGGKNGKLWKIKGN
ncbi:hypothetical protein GEV33_002300 [Tenebrio molitor]|uniref:Uncharacterized protein n=1 Tax=Tenebrio molitor TaxID=7067 RepID=A0A8J6LPH7_TENMO|nr:hypothetical protein GEV33_002300 [Tenebrio molitor]